VGLAVSAGIAVVLLLAPLVPRIYWVGATDLEIECVVIDAITGQPIKQASIHVESEGGFCAESEKGDFVLITDANGSAKRLVKECMSYGTSGWNIDTYFVHLPWWRYQVKAEGYSPTDWRGLDVPENMSRVKRGHPATLIVETTLRK
jgi:hypothetical protein